MIGPRYWSTGITVRYMTGSDGSQRWGALLQFFDNGFCDDGPAGISTEGSLGSRYFVRDGGGFAALPAVLDTLIADAGRLGIVFGTHGKPMLYVKGDGESDTEEYHPQWRQLLREQAERLGWDTYTDPADVVDAEVVES